VEKEEGRRKQETREKRTRKNSSIPPPIFKRKWDR
jgi:hypothetical protein